MKGMVVMDYMSGIFDLNGAIEKNISHGEDYFRDGFLLLQVSRSSNFSYDSLPLSYNPETGIVCGILGYFTNLKYLKNKYSISGDTDTEIIGALFKLMDIKFLEEIDGHFITVIYDASSRKIYIFQPEHGSMLPLYYQQDSERLIFSTSLKLLLKNSTNKREMNMEAARKFLCYEHIIPDSSTLIKGAEKLIPQSYLIADGESGKIQKPQYIPEKLEISHEEAEKSFIEFIRKNIRNIYSGLSEPRPNITLTRGYDSNLTLYLLRKITDEEINAVTVNGGGEHNEVPAVERIIDNYSDIKLFTDDFEESLMLSYPDLVWRYEGYIFEAGMFLRYMICRLLDELNLRTAFFGAGSNEIISREKKSAFYSKIDDLSTTIRNITKKTIIGDIYYSTIGSKLPEDKLRREFRSGSPRVKYNIPFDYILKMHDILLNSFAIQGVYPFISKEILSAALELRSENYEKSFFKESVRKTVDPEISRQLEQSDIVSDTESIYSFSEETILKVFEKETVLQLLSSEQIKLLRDNPKKHHVFVSQLVYLHLFDRLFISGEYDNRFDESGISIKLDELMN